MHYEKLFPGRFIKSADFDGKDVTLTVKNVRAEEIDDKTKAIMRFEETKRELVLNRTNAEALRVCFGPQVEAWVGKRVTFFPATIKDPFGEGEISAIRVRGSPDITEPKSATVQRGRKTIRVSVRPTGKPNGKAPPPAVVASAPVPSVGEPPPDVPLPGADRQPGEDDDVPL